MGWHLQGKYLPPPPVTFEDSYFLHNKYMPA